MAHDVKATGDVQRNRRIRACGINAGARLLSFLRLFKWVAPILFLVSTALGSAAGGSIANPDLLKALSPEVQSMLKKQGLAASVSDAEQMFDIYEHTKSALRPIFVTTDPLLHTFHIIFDYVLRTTEDRELYPALQAMLTAMFEYESRLCDTIRNPKLREALHGNIAYLSVPLSYLDSGFKIPESVAKVVNEERASIEAHQGFAASAVTGIEQDFSQYVPRGHYAFYEHRKRYFKAMTYIEQTVFPLDAGDGVLALRLTRQAFLLACALWRAQTTSGVAASELRDQILNLTTYIAGAAQDMSPADYISAAGWSSDSKFAASDNSIRTLIRKLESHPAPEIVSRLIWTGEPRKRLLSMSLLGRRYIPDGAIMQRLMFDAVGTSESPRHLPMGLDLMAVLGSDRARLLLTQVYQQDSFKNYVGQLDTLRRQYSRFSPLEWNVNLYRAWLYALKLNLEPVRSQGSGSLVAGFVGTPAYDDKTLVTSSGSWTELRHDLILLAQQPVELTGMAPEEPESLVVYVEPKPEVFRQLARMASDLQDKLSLSTFKVKGVDEKLKEFRRLADGLADIAQGELQDAEIPPEGVDLCRDYGGILESCVNFDLQPDSSKWPFFYNTEEQDRRIVADVATSPTTGLVLEEAVGNPCNLYAIVPCQGSQYLAIGSCYSYYEFTKPMSERMTDQQWQDMTPKPDMPGWTKSFVSK